MNSEEVDRIVDAFCRDEVIETPLGTMTGKSTIAGSKIPFADYTLDYEGENVTIKGVVWGHGTLFLLTEKGREDIRIPYDLDKPVEYYEDDEECLCDEDEDEDIEPIPTASRQSTLEAFL